MDVSLDTVLANIKDPHNWADPETIIRIIAATPSVRGMVYGNFAEEKFVDWLTVQGVRDEDHDRDDDHAKTKSDRNLNYRGRRYTIQLKSMQTNSIKQLEDGTFKADVQVDASDRRPITLPDGQSVTTTCYKVDEFDILATTIHPFTGVWDFAFRLNTTLDRSRGRNYSEEIRAQLLATTQKLFWPLADDSPWTTDLWGLIAENPELGEPIPIEDSQPPTIE